MHCRRKRLWLVITILNTHCKALNTFPVKHYNLGLGIAAAHKKACTDLFVHVTSLNSLSRKKCMTGWVFFFQYAWLKMTTWPLLGMVEEIVSIVNMRERTARGIWKSPDQTWAWPAEETCSREKRERRCERGKEIRVERTRSQESAWLRCLGYLGITSWQGGKGKLPPGLKGL